MSFQNKKRKSLRWIQYAYHRIALHIYSKNFFQETKNLKESHDKKVSKLWGKMNYHADKVRDLKPTHNPLTMTNEALGEKMRKMSEEIDYPDKTGLKKYRRH